MNVSEDQLLLYENQLHNEVNKLIVNKWYFLNMNWNIITNRYNHRSKLLKVNNIRNIKDVLLNQLGYIPVFYFLNVLFGTIEYPGPYPEIEKGLILLYHIVSGFTGNKMSQFIPYTTFYELYKRFWITNFSKIKKIVTNDIGNLFSNIKIRLISSILKNPRNFQNVTLFIDGHDGKIKYYDPDVKTSSFYSYKLKGPGLRTQIVTDINKMIIFISKSEKCAVSNDGVMFLNMKLEEFIHAGDCLGMDGGYTLYILKFKEKCLEIGKDISDKNFSHPIRKDNNIKLNIEELDYNKRFGSFRSEIENHFSLLASKFNRFNNNRAALQITDMKHYNLQFKVACLLLNMWKMIKDYNIEAQQHHMLWYNDNFEFPKKETKLDIIFNNKIDADKNYNEMFDLQQKLLTLDLNELENYDDNNSNEVINDSDEEMEELTHKKSRKGKEKEVVTSVNIHTKYQFPK
jgi:hypothetical protein